MSCPKGYSKNIEGECIKIPAKGFLTNYTPPGVFDLIHKKNQQSWIRHEGSKALLNLDSLSKRKIFKQVFKGWAKGGTINSNLNKKLDSLGRDFITNKIFKNFKF